MMNGRRLAFGLAGLAVVGMVVFWLWPRSPVELSDQGYDAMLALYRVCNQRSVEGLAQVEEQWEAIQVQEQQPETTQHLIADILRQAKSEQWKAASISCRRALQDQVR